MRSVGVRELKHRTSAILRRTREKGEEVAITFRGEIIAYLVPALRPKVGGRSTTAGPWTDLDRLAAEIGTRWPKGLSATRAVRSERRG